MQTFLAYASFDDSAAILDYRRLGKQRLETYQIFTTLLGIKIVNDKAEELTGNYRTAYYDGDGFEVNLDDVNPGDGTPVDYIAEIVPVTRTVHLPESQWRLAPSWPTMSRINNPVVGMWRGYEHALLKYQEAIIDVWVSNFGYDDRLMAMTAYLFRHFQPIPPRKIKFPPWLGWEPFHTAQQSNLIRKDPEHYEHLFPRVPDNLQYVYPVSGP